MLAPHHHHQEPVEGTPTASQPTAANADNATRGGADDVRADFLRERGFEFPPNAEEFRNLNSMPKMEKNRFFLFVPLLSFFSVGACVRV